MKLTIRAAAGAFAALALGLGARAAAADHPTAPAYTSYHNVPSAGCANGSCDTAARPGWSLSATVNSKVTQARYGLPFQPCCKPKLSPGGCFGHYQTQWTPWAAVCPTVSQVVVAVHAAPPAPAVAPAPTLVVPGPTTPPAPLPTAPAPTPAKETPPAPKKDTPPAGETTPKPPTTPSAPPKVPASDLPGKLDERGLILPPVPEIPVVSQQPRF